MGNGEKNRLEIHRYRLHTQAYLFMGGALTFGLAFGNLKAAVELGVLGLIPLGVDALEERERRQDNDYLAEQASSAPYDWQVTDFKPEDI